MLHSKKHLSGEAPVTSNIDTQYDTVGDEDMTYNEEDGSYGRREGDSFHNQGGWKAWKNQQKQMRSQEMRSKNLPSIHTMDGVWYLRVPKDIAAMKLISHVADVLTCREDKVVVEDVDID